MKGKTLPLVVCLAIGAILADCGPAPAATSEVTPTATWEVIEVEVTREITTEEVIYCDAYWLVNAHVWLDENANGVWDEGEEPLPGIAVKAVDAQGRGVHGAASDAQGVATLESMIPCEAGYFEILAEIPPGYRLTTAPRVESSWGGETDVQFGFVRDASIATSTPLLPTETPAPSTHTDAPVTPSPSPSAGDTWKRPAGGAVMVYVPAGEFLMGSSDDDPYADAHGIPQHTVYLDAFWIDKYEVTNAQYRECVEAGACQEPGCWDDSDYNAPDQPVVCVDWNEAQDYAAWAGGRLPTEAEWEKAARGTDGRIYPWGDSPPDCYKANYTYDCAGRPLPVGTHPDGASPFGVLDMAGNVWEWVADWYDEDYYSRSPFRNPQGPETGDSRVLRGGAFPDAGWLVRCAYRNWHDPNYWHSDLGFRVVVDAGPSDL